MAPWVCVYCEAGAHSHCISRIDCECIHEKAVWISPGRRAELRTGARPVDAAETEFQLAYRAHCTARRDASARRR